MGSKSPHRVRPGGKKPFGIADVVRNFATDDEEALFEMLDGVRGLIEHYQHSIRLFSAVEARLIVAAHDAFHMPFG